VTVGTQVVLDACVLVNAALRDTLLRIAEPPRLYLPRWSKDILEETTRTLEGKLGLTFLQTSHLVAELKPGDRQTERSGGQPRGHATPSVYP
jgi:hypothetical protein